MSRIEEALVGSSHSVILIDGNNMFARNGHVFSDLVGPDYRPTGAIYGSVKEIMRICNEVSARHIIFVKDAGVPAFRMELIEKHADEREDGDRNGYKQQRARNRTAKDDEVREAYKAQLGYCHEVFNPLGITVTESPGFEADDLIGSIVRSFKDTRFVIVSDDKDMRQLACHARVYLPRTKEMITEAPPRACTLMRAIIGDASDNIPGVKGVGEAGTHALFDLAGLMECATPKQLFSGLSKWMKNIPEGTQKRVITAAQKIIESKQRVTDYWRATSLTKTSGCHESSDVQLGLWDNKKAYAVMRAYGLREFRENWDGLQRTFSRISKRASK